MQCRNCGFAYVPEVPRTNELVHNLSWEKQHGKEAARRLREYRIQQYLDSATRWRLALFPRTQPADLLNRLGPAEGDVVDIGCGSSDNLGAIDRRFTVHGIEISAELAARARQGLGANGGRVIQASALEGLQAFPDFSLAGAVLRSFLEHDSQA